MSLKPGEIQFHQWCEPPLTAGDYSLGVTQAVAQLGKTFDGTLEFSVAGPRFSLNPSDIYSVYPPKGHHGSFANSLPHVVFTRRTLPWERNVVPDAPSGAERPWMALLLFTDSDPVPEIKQRTVRELTSPPPADGAVGPKIARLAAYESWTEPCNVIDVPTATFRAIAPRLDDLKYLAHVREVETDHKETMSFLADGWFSIVMGNRFPKPEQAGADQAKAVENTVFLVSLEGMQDYLPGGAAVTVPNVRLAVLASWSFHCYAAYNFKSLMQSLNVGTFNLPAPQKNPALSGEEQRAAQYVAGAFTRGYVALNHRTRQGEPTVSWCRGPLTPVQIEAQARYPFQPVPDGLLRYDYNTGVMDVSYAAASQLGRLLALQDRSFARALCAWRSTIQRMLRRSAPEEAVVRALNSATTEETIEGALDGALEVEARRSAGTIDAIVAPDDRCPPLAVRQWLARLILLYRVPFINLVPHEGLLPGESMRFFRIDPGWIKCLLEGACSVGRNSTEQQAVDEFLGNRFLDFLGDAVSGIRRRRAVEDDPAAPVAPLRKVNWPLEGFLLRSSLVEGWQGLEMRAWQTWDAARNDGTPVDPLRIDRVAPDIMLCIFDGPVVRIEVRQPPEGMHFGAATRETGYYKRNLRRLISPAQAVDQLDPAREISIPLREPRARVVDVASLAKQIEQTLKSPGVLAMTPAEAFTSAEFGLEMTESPGRVVIFTTQTVEATS
ncbi:MAG: hypothetical protein LAO77_01725 [Acidobacteriia bacterium]|nr:hypothetical protein [Terriglobia bacterium]